MANWQSATPHGLNGARETRSYRERKRLDSNLIESMQTHTTDLKKWKVKSCICNYFICGWSHFCHTYDIWLLTATQYEHVPFTSNATILEIFTRKKNEISNNGILNNVSVHKYIGWNMCHFNVSSLKSSIIKPPELNVKSIRKKFNSNSAIYAWQTIER